ncbi:MAG: NAD(P)/FAD-dependent oxidoreductase [Gemmatimonadetes bacterium]|nr:NAD(P)/FAD-dependent oxidoreductase [Gemmatimonadota bacterium]
MTDPTRGDGRGSVDSNGPEARPPVRPAAIPSSDVLVVGLGPAGSATAIRLARAGLRVTAIDRATFPREKACSEYLSPEGVRQLELLGVAERLLPLGVALEGARVHGARGSALEGLFRKAAPPGMREVGLSVPRRVLDAVLVDQARAAGVTVLERTRLVELVRTAGATTGAIVRQGDRLDQVSSRVVVGADGLHGVAARLLGGRRTEPLRRVALVAHVAEVDGMGSTAEMHVGTGLYVGLNAIGGGVTNVAVVGRPDRILTVSGDPEANWLAALERFPAVRGRVRRDRIVRAVLATGRFAVRARRVVADGALLVGDAADFFDPFTGEGICTALRGAGLAAPIIEAALAEHRVAPAAALDRYRIARREAFRGKWAVERLIGYGMTFPALFDRALGRLDRRGMGHTLIGVTGDFLPARAVLNPGFLMAMMV